MRFLKNPNPENKNLLLVILVISTVLIYFPSLFNQFQLEWDDQWQVVDNPYIKDFSFASIAEMFTTFYQSQYSPVNIFLNMLVFAIFGMSPAAFHAVSLLLHICNAVLVFYIVIKLLSFAAGKQAIVFKNISEQNIRTIAFFTALIFAIHPMQVETVAWISASKVLQFSFFFLSAFLTYIRYIETLKWKYLFYTFILFVLSMGCKEQAVVFPFLLPAFDFFYYRNFKTTKVYIEKIPFLLATIIMAWITSGQTGDETNTYYPLIYRGLFAGYAFLEYLFKLLVPAKLSYFYFFPMEKGETIPVRFWFFLLPISIMIYFVIDYWRKGNRVLVFAFLFYTINIALFLHILPFPRMAIIADRYVYLSSIPVFAIIVMYFFYYIYNKFPNWNHQNNKKYKILIYSTILVYCLVLAGYSNIRTRVWYDSNTLKKEFKELLKEKESNAQTHKLSNSQTLKPSNNRTIKHSNE